MYLKIFQYFSMKFSIFLNYTIHLKFYLIKKVNLDMNYNYYILLIIYNYYTNGLGRKRYASIIRFRYASNSSSFCLKSDGLSTPRPWFSL